MVRYEDHFTVLTYFAKAVSRGKTGRTMIEGEFESMKAIHAVSPELAPEPLGWGRYDQQQPETYFLIM
jgi:protein-ribulosamine 3-kinase